VGVNTSRVLAKLAQLPLDKRVRKKLIKKIVMGKNKYQTKITLYAWEVVDNVAHRSFFSKKETIIDWCTSHDIWDNEELSRGVAFYSWEMPIKDIFAHASDGKIVGIPLAKVVTKPHLSTIPQEIRKDIETKP